MKRRLSLRFDLVDIPGVRSRILCKIYSTHILAIILYFYNFYKIDLGNSIVSLVPNLLILILLCYIQGDTKVLLLSKLEITLGHC